MDYRIICVSHGPALIALFVQCLKLQECATPPVLESSTPPIAVVCTCNSTTTQPSIFVAPGCSHQLRFLPTGQLVRPSEDPPLRRQVSLSVFDE